MAWEVEYTEEFLAWWDELTEPERIAITAAVALLQEKGPALTRPYVDTLSKDSQYPNMKELRLQHAGRPYRICSPSIRGSRRFF